MTYDINIEKIDPSHIAVVGMSGAFPGAADVDVFWSNLLQGKESISDLTEQNCIDAGVEANTVALSNYVKRAAYIETAKFFDAHFFGYSEAEAALLDPQHRLLLQHAWAALESAGYIPNAVPGMVAVYAGCGFNRYLLDKMEINATHFSVDDFQKMIANDKDFLSTRLSHKLNLTGPSLTVQTACSTSLVAIQMGCNALLTYQADVALCGGVSVNVPHGAGYLYTEGMIFSPTGVCNPFDKDANGTVFGEGVGVVALKRLEDAVADNDPIIAVVRGAAVNNDGNKKVGFTAPSAEGQTEVIRFAQSIADTDADAIDFIETHGTGTALGDPIEIAALKSVFGKSENKHCALGTLKANIGHLDAAAGVASFIKAALVVRDKRIPPNIHFDQHHPAIDFEQTPFYLNKNVVELEQECVVAGVSAFGVGGTNAHVILHSPPVRTSQKKIVNADTVCVVSGKQKHVAEEYKQNVKAFLNAYPDKLHELSHTLYFSRSRFEYRSFVAAHATGHNNVVLENANIYRASSNPKIALLFPGQGSEFEGMAAAYYEQSEVFRQHFDECMALFSALSSYDLKAVLLSSEKNDDIHLTQYAQPALFVVEYCIWQILAHANIKPEVMLGHSLGQYVAACIAGVFNVKDALRLVIRRGEIMAKAETGGMIAVFCTKAELVPMLPDTLDIAAMNSPKRMVVSGSEMAIELFVDELEKNNIDYRKLSVSHGFHSRSMDAVLAAFRHELDGINLANPQATIVATSEKNISFTDKEYWVTHLRDTVDFSYAVETLAKYTVDTCIEVGPGKALSIFVADQLDTANINIVSAMLKRGQSHERNEYVCLLASLWCCGVNIDCQSEGVIAVSQRINAPTYPFVQKEYWLPSKIKDDSEGVSLANSASQKLTLLQEIEQVWSEIFSIEQPDHNDNFFDLGGDSFIGIQLADKLTKKLNVNIAIADIIRHPSIAELYGFLGSSISHKSNIDFDIIFCLDKRGSAPPLFLVSGAHDDIYSETDHSTYEKDAYRYFGTLVKHLGHKRPIFGFRPQGILYGEKFLSSVEEIATQNIEHMKKVQPQGPYLIGGECVGGLIALEMSKQLVSAGDQVKHVVLMDTVFPSFSFRLKEGLLVRYRRIKRAFISAIMAVKQLDFQQFAQRLFVCLKLSLVYFFPVTEKMQHKKNAYFGSQKYLDLLLKYKPYDIRIPVHLISNEQWAKQKKRLGWDKSEWPQFEFIVVKGDHQTRLTDFGPELGETILAITDD